MNRIGSIYCAIVGSCRFFGAAYVYLRTLHVQAEDKVEFTYRFKVNVK